MAIVTKRQQRLTEVGIIRIGEKRKTSGGKEYPAARETFRLTSRHKQLLEMAQLAYGGELRPWDDPKHPGHWELLTATTTLKAIFSTKPVDGGDLESLSQYYEQWAGNTRTHCCNGSICEFWEEVGKDSKGNPVHRKGKRPCTCKTLEERACKLVSRVSVILSDVPSIGVWRINTSSQVFDQETGAFVDFLELMGAKGPTPIELSIDWREKRTGPGSPTSKFPVVVIQIDNSPAPLPRMLDRYRQAAFGMGDVGVLPPGQAQLGAGAKELPPPPPPEEDIVVEANVIETQAATVQKAEPAQPTQSVDDTMSRITALFEGLLGESGSRDLKAYIEGEGGSWQQFGAKALKAKNLTAESLGVAADRYIEEVKNANAK